MSGKIVLAYSGGLDTSISIKWIKDKYNMDVIAALIDCGQPDDLKKSYRRALEIGAIKSVIVDAKDEFINDFILPSIKANLKYEKKYPLATALARPLIVKKLVDIARKEGAKAVAHGCTAKGNDQVRFDVGAGDFLETCMEFLKVFRDAVAGYAEFFHAKKCNIK